MSNQFRGNLEQQQTTDLGDEEMRAVQSNYTACLEDQDLPPSTRGMYNLLANPGVSIQKADAVRCMDRYIRDITLDLNTARQDLMARTDDNRLFRFHAQLGDYTGALCTALKELDHNQPSAILSEPWTLIVRAIDKFDQQLGDWVASGRTGTYPYSIHMDAIKCRVQQLVELGFQDLDLDIALFAIRSYTRRNFIAHGRSFDLYMEERYAGLAEYLDYIDRHLEDVLPNKERIMVGKWRRLLTFYRHVHIRQVEGGSWVRQIPLKTLLGSLPLLPGRPWGAALRIRIEMGNFRPIELNGQPPSNVSWDSSSSRHQSELSLRGIKRPATEQSSKAPRVKRARIANRLDSTTEDTPRSIKDSDALGHQRSLLKVHDLSVTLAQHDPTKAASFLSTHLTKLQTAINHLHQAIGDKESSLRKKNQPRSKV